MTIKCTNCGATLDESEKIKQLEELVNDLYFVLEKTYAVLIKQSCPDDYSDAITQTRLVLDRAKSIL